MMRPHSRLRRTATACCTCLALLAGLLPATAADVTSGPEDRSSLTLTLYAGGLGLVQERRSLAIPAGRSEIELAGVAARVDPSTVQLQAISGAPVRTLEQRFEHDLLSPDRLLQRYLGRTVQLVTRHEGTETFTDATLLSLQGGRVFRVGDRIWLNHPGEVVLPELPGGLRERPALVWTVDADRAGDRQVELSYLTDGLGWSASYVLRLDPAGTSLDLTAWVTVDNAAGVAYENATVRLVAGDVRRVSSGRRTRTQSTRAVAQMEMASEGRFQEEAVFEYHLYELDGKLRLPEAQSRQLLLLQSDRLATRRRILFQGGRYSVRTPLRETLRNQKGEIELLFANGSGDGDGRPLPAGVARVYQADGEGLLLFLGEDRLTAAPAGREVRLRLGRAFDLEMDRTQTDHRAVASGRYDREVAFRIEIRNGGKQEAAVLVREPVPGDWKLLESSPGARRADAGTLEFERTIPAGGTEVITYRVALDAG